MPAQPHAVSVIDALRAHARDRGNDLAFCYDDEPLRFAQLLDDASWLARRFHGAGLGRGARCVVMLPSGLDFIRVVYAAQLLAAVPVAIDPALTPAGRAVRIATARPDLVVTTDGLVSDAVSDAPGAVVTTPAQWHALPARPPASVTGPAPDDLAYLQFTSGTSGAPRACAVDHRALMASLRAMQARYAITHRDVMANWVPLHYASGLVRHVFGTVAYGCPSHLIQPSAGAAARWLPLMSRVRATLTTAPDSAFRLASQLVPPGDVDLRALRFAGSGGEPVRADTIRAFEARFGISGVVQPAYGLSEGTLAIAANAPGSPLRLDGSGSVSCGPPLDGVEIRVVDEHGAPCPPGTVGELQFRGVTLFRGYLNDEAGTRAVMRPGGWCQPGDRASLDAAGRVFIHARTRALIKRGGAGIAPREVEEPVGRLPGVLACAALGVRRHQGHTEDLVVVVEADRASTDVASIAAAVQQASVAAVRLLPAQVVIVVPGTLPRSAAGKIQYAELRARVEGDGFGSATIGVG